MPYSLSVTVAGETQTARGALEFDGVEQPGFEPAKVVRRDAAPPAATSLQAGLDEALLELAERAVLQEFHRAAALADEESRAAGITPSVELDRVLWLKHLAKEDALAVFEERLEAALRTRAAYAPPLPCQQ